MTAVLALGLGACDPAGSDSPGPTVPQESTTTPSTVAAIDITVKPDVVTIEYAQAVMTELDHVLGDAIRAMVADGGPNMEYYNKLNAVYDEPEFENNQSVYGEASADGVDEFRNPPGDPITRVERLLRTDPNCVIFVVDRDFSPFLIAPNPDSGTKGYIAWSPRAEASDPSGLNRTPWSIVFDGDTLDNTEPLNAC